MTTVSTDIPSASTDRLAANLRALSRTSPEAAERIRTAPQRSGLTFTSAGDGALAATLDGKALASRRRPRDEARRLAEQFDLENAGAAVVLGFGLGHHLEALAQRIKRHGVIIIFEPDVSLLRSVFERIDHTGWMRNANFIMLTDANDRGAISSSMHGIEPLLSLGVRVLEHPPSRSRLGAEAPRFTDAFTKSLAAVRTQVVTTLVQTDVTFRNEIGNAEHYARCPGVADLQGRCQGRAAVTVSAGPSLRRNMHLLKEPGLRDRCVIIAAQTVLKTLLAEGVRPHFVTALDFHEISKRFYEGLTPDDVRDITLVVEPKANPAILEAYPGPIRCVGTETLDLLLGPNLAGEHGRLPSGSTVAHLSYHLARHLGCDPVIMIGQDLAFTDGQYYSKGAAIHDVWAGEINEFNTLEMMEWERIARHRRMLHKANDHLGRTVYTDEQMTTYLNQFQRLFHTDAGRGLTVIDATEGGVAKSDAQAMPLREAIETYAGFAPALPDLSPAADASPHADERALVDRLREVRTDVGRLAALSREAESLLDRMLERFDDREQVNRLIRKSHRVRDEATNLQPAYKLVHRINQTGSFKRARADRLLALDENAGDREKQRGRIERDKTNVRWLAEAAEELARILDQNAPGIADARKPKRSKNAAAGGSTADSPRRAPSRVAAVLPVDFEHSSLGARHDLGAPLAGQSALSRTLHRLARCENLHSVVLLTDNPQRALRCAKPLPENLRVETWRTTRPPLSERGRSVRAARLWSAACWRGGIGSLTCYDEVFAPRATAEALERLECDAAMLLGADWAAVDPALCDAVIDRHRENPEDHRITFTQAPPGLAGAVVETNLVRELTDSDVGPVASIGGMLGFSPAKPAGDPIAQRVCAPVPASVRDALHRFIPDAADRRRELDRRLRDLDDDPDDIDAPRLAESFTTDAPEPQAPQRVTIELCAQREAFGGARQDWLGLESDIDRPPLAMETAERFFKALAHRRRDAAVTFAGLGDPLLHPQWLDLIALAKRCGIAGVHVRTDLLADTAAIDALADSGADVISVDLLADAAETYAVLTGADRFREALENLDRLLKRRRFDGGLPHPWVVPRITRCDAVYEQIESFYDKWLMLAGAAVIDPLPRAMLGERIEPLGKPSAADERDRREAMCARSDGRVILDEDFAHSEPIGEITNESLDDLWPRLLRMRRAQREAAEPAVAEPAC